MLRLLAESIFAYIDELAGESVAGYAQAQAAGAGALEGRRRALAELLLRSPPADLDAVAAAARDAGWQLPRELAAIALAVPDDALAGALDPGALMAADVILLPDPGGPGRRAAIERALSGRAAAVGPAVPTREAARSLRWARATLSLDQPGDGPSFADERLVELALAEAREPLAALRAQRLAALDALPAGKRERLAATLGAWLAHQGSAPAAAAALHLHPQTVRYRLGQLRELLGEQLDDPGGGWIWRSPCARLRRGPGPRPAPPRATRGSSRRRRGRPRRSARRLEPCESSGRGRRGSRAARRRGSA